MTKRELATQYVALRKEFDGKDFKPTLKCFNIDWLCREFKKEHLEVKIDAVRHALSIRASK